MTITSEGKRQTTRHVPQRTCIGCRTVKPKRELVRVVRTDTGGATVDPTGKSPGRGVYICKAKSCWYNALSKENIDRALRTKVSMEDRRELARYGDTLAGQ
jgi:predicted RNA-binding protein YlxR (DUF448 family)